jgi:DNA-binding LacI/PurR family transcriptional regulator
MPPSVESVGGRRRGRRTVTIARIAEQAGVSVPTVSKVINGRTDVARATRERVEAIIREHGYRRPERVAPQSRLLELIFHELDSAWAMELIRGVERVAAENNLAVVLTELGGARTPGRAWLEAVLERRPAGVISVFSELSRSQQVQLQTRGIPFVVVDPTGEPLSDTPSVGATNWSGGAAAGRHLLELGHRRIAMIGGPPRALCSRARVDGCRAAMEAAGSAVDRRLVRDGDFHVAAGLEQGRALLRLRPRPTAVFAANDLQAFGVYEAARELRLRIPEELSVIGFDDLPVASWVGPPLTTVRQPLVDMAMCAARLVLARGAGEVTGAPTRIELATPLVVRQSTGPAPG